ncbi:hypothetical protein Mzhil_1151 [Methanosalsum zhilinae DSM 4017]|uniref:Uncharacterized protein n=1 Tax=Methanosalsum zhilinae (strain DSM 4017 / NBRC 107636 / OCM 62 / WeN5) TaxID=679901 RepID=F7XMB1_METZD|nr:hypothetical protein Mzhil_1151 [Methanosalsum zhilinae DSM 4017]
MQEKADFETDSTDSIAIYGYIIGILVIAALYISGLLA